MLDRCAEQRAGSDSCTGSKEEMRTDSAVRVTRRGKDTGDLSRPNDAGSRQWVAFETTARPGQYCPWPMRNPLIVRLLLDAQDAFGELVDRVDGLDRPHTEGLNDAAWVVAHTSFFHDCWLNGDAQGLPKER